MQRPTHNRLHVRDARDAHTVFEAVRQGITSGAIFVWEESDDDLGLKRWTDGRVWSQSRMREPYLFYDERLPDEARTGDPSSRSSGNFRFVDGIARSGPISPALSHYDRSEHHPMGLVKQAYSAWVLENPEAKPRKWHLTAYFTYKDLPKIPTTDQDPVLRGVTVPAAVYRSGKARSRNSDAGLGASPPSSPPLYSRGPAGPGVPNQASASVSHTADSSTALPSLQMAVTPQPFDPRVPRRGNDSRHAEDQRIIQMLNSRHVM